MLNGDGGNILLLSEKVLPHVEISMWEELGQLHNLEGTQR